MASIDIVPFPGNIPVIDVNNISKTLHFCNVFEIYHAYFFAGQDDSHGI